MSHDPYTIAVCSVLCLGIMHPATKTSKSPVFN